MEPRRTEDLETRVDGRCGSRGDRNCRRPRVCGDYEEYHPFGSTAWWAGESSTVSQKRYRYTGMERDEETGLSYHHHRYYATWIGRWTSSDPIGLKAGVNRHCFCRSNPIRERDSSGLAPPEIDWGKDDAHTALDKAFNQPINTPWDFVRRGAKIGILAPFAALEYAAQHPFDTVLNLPRYEREFVVQTYMLSEKDQFALDVGIVALGSPEVIGVVPGAAPSKVPRGEKPLPPGNNNLHFPANNNTHLPVFEAPKVAVGQTATPAPLETPVPAVSSTGSKGSTKPGTAGTGGGGPSSGISPVGAPGSATGGQPTTRGLDWGAVVPKKGPYKGQSRAEHVRLHNVDDLSKDVHGVFQGGDAVDLTNEAWALAERLGVKPDAAGNLTVPMGRQVGTQGGKAGAAAATPAPLENISIIVVPGTNWVVTAFPTL